MVNILAIAVLLSGVVSHDLKMSVCEMERAADGQLETRFYLFHDDLKQALYADPNAPEIKPKDAQNYISKNTQLSLNGQPSALRFQALEYRKDQVCLTYRTDISPHQKIEKINLTNRLLIEHFRTQVNMVYFVKPDGERLVKMLDATTVEAKFDG